MQIGIIGAGNIGRVAAGHFVEAGHEVAIANSRGPASLADLVADLGSRARAATVAEAAAFGEVVLEAIGFTPLAVGSLADSDRIEPGSPLYNDPMTLAEAEATLAGLCE